MVPSVVWFSRLGRDPCGKAPPFRNAQDGSRGSASELRRSLLQSARERKATGFPHGGRPSRKTCRAFEIAQQTSFLLETTPRTDVCRLQFESADCNPIGDAPS